MFGNKNGTGLISYLNENVMITKKQHNTTYLNTARTSQWRSKYICIVDDQFVTKGVQRGQISGGQSSNHSS